MAKNGGGFIFLVKRSEAFTFMLAFRDASKASAFFHVTDGLMFRSPMAT